MKTLASCLALTLGIASVASAAIPGTKNCGVDKYRNCIFQSCQSLRGGPAGETPGCKPPPYRPQTCDSVRLWLPTVIVYPVIESLYGPNSDAGVAAVNSASANYISITLNPLWVIMYGYGVNAIPPYVQIGPMVKDEKKSGKSEWSQESKKGLVHILKDVPALPTSAVAMAKSKTDERIFMTSWRIFMRAVDEIAGSGKYAMKFSWSPYSSMCYPIIEDSSKLMARYNPVRAYRTLGQYLNKYSETPISKLESEMKNAHNGIPQTTNKIFDDKCSDDMKTWEGRPVYFLYRLYWMSITHSQMQCNG